MSTDPLTGSRAVVPTDRGGRYAKQLAAHLGRRLTTTWDDGSGTGLITFDRGRCTMTATANELDLAITVDDPTDPAETLAQLDRMEDVVGRHLVRFGARAELVAEWVRSDGSPGRVNRNDDEPTEHHRPD